MNEESGAEQEALCPYCNQPIEPPPKRRKKCPHCGQPVYVKRKQDLFPTIYVTEEQAQAIKDMENLKVHGLTSKDFWRKEKELVQKFGRRPSYRDVLWALYNEAITRTTDLRNLSLLYSGMAWFVCREGKDPFPLLQQSQKMDLLYKQSHYGEIHPLMVEISTCPDACPECQKLNRTTYTIQEALEEMPLPNKNCSYKGHGQEYPFCRCQYLVYISDEALRRTEEELKKALEKTGFQIKCSGKSKPWWRKILGL
jgi:hypothetical protein